MTSSGGRLSQHNPLYDHIRVCGTRLFKIHVGIILMETEYYGMKSVNNFSGKWNEVEYTLSLNEGTYREINSRNLSESLELNDIIWNWLIVSKSAVSVNAEPETVD